MIARALAALGIVVVVGSVVFRAGPSWAEPSTEAVTLGKQQFDLGRTEFQLGNYEQALGHFEESYRLTGRSALLYNLAVTERRLYDRIQRLDWLDRAIEHFRTFLADARANPQLADQAARAARGLKESEDERSAARSRRARGEELLRVAEDLLAEGHGAEAEAQLDRYQKNADPPNDRAGVARAWAMRARLRAARGELAPATDAYARALSLDGTLPAPTEGPAAEAFGAARAAVGQAHPLSVLHAQPGILRPGAPLELQFTVENDAYRLVAGVEVHYRAGAGAFARLPREPAGRIALPRAFVASLPAGARIEYYAEVVDADGAALERLGTPALPFVVEVGTAPRKKVVRSWWFWTATVGAVAAVAVGLGVGLHYGLAQPPTGTITTNTLGTAPLLRW